jgi:isopentenyl diphosphate isomerase/L-lactate dehydrogenase-like FMN-dependent dehydrogenase
VVTADVPAIGNREYNRRNRLGMPFRLTHRAMVDGVLHPRWLAGTFMHTLLVVRTRENGLPYPTGLTGFNSWF